MSDLAALVFERALGQVRRRSAKAFRRGPTWPFPLNRAAYGLKLFSAIDRDGDAVVFQEPD